MNTDQLAKELLATNTQIKWDNISPRLQEIYRNIAERAVELLGNTKLTEDTSAALHAAVQHLTEMCREKDEELKRVENIQLLLNSTLDSLDSAEKNLELQRMENGELARLLKAQEKETVCVLDRLEDAQKQVRYLEEHNKNLSNELQHLSTKWTEVINWVINSGVGVVGHSFPQIVLQTLQHHKNVVADKDARIRRQTEKLENAATYIEGLERDVALLSEGNEPITINLNINCCGQVL